jgi:hypothetical protein
MRLRKLMATMTMVALLGSDLVLAVSPAIAQTSTPGNGNGYQMTPGLVKATAPTVVCCQGRARRLRTSAGRSSRKCFRRCRNLPR